MIPKLEFGRTGHKSARIIFGGYALSQASPAQAGETLDLLMAAGVNHIDTAPMYGKAETRIGSWLASYPDHFFIATKTRSRSYQGAWKNLMRSLERLNVDRIDLWQMHGLTNTAGWEKAMGPGGALEAFLEARDQGLVRFLGITGHGLKSPLMHLRSLERFGFDSVMLPYNYTLMQNKLFVKDFNDLLSLCRKKGVALQTIKSIARTPWESRPRTHNTYFYEPLLDQEAIDHAVHWALSLENSFLVSVGDLQVLPSLLEAARGFEGQPPEDIMDADVKKYGLRPIFK